jgi:hypothetical protein
MGMGNTSLEITLGFLPKLSESAQVIDVPTSQRIRSIIERQNGVIGSLLDLQLNAVIASTTDEIQADNEGRLTMTDLQLQGIIARSLIAGAAQVLLVTAASLQQANILELSVDWYPENTAA